MKKLNWIDILVYKLFYWRWNKILSEREDVLDYFIRRLRLWKRYYQGTNNQNALPKKHEIIGCPK